MYKSLALVLLCCAAAACGDGGAEVSPEVLEGRRVAARRACISTQLAQQAADELQTLEQSLAGVGSAGPLVFARAYEQHAQMRQAVYAQVDSALNYSPTAEDSARHAAAAEQYQIRAPTPGTVEANVIQNYEQDFAALFADADHPCNWQTEVESQ